MSIKQDPKLKNTLLTAVEIAAVVLFAIWFCRNWLTLDPLMTPENYTDVMVQPEYAMVIRSNAIWNTFRECGACFLWNGSLKGGYPAFAEMQGSVFHPFVILFTLLFGVANGSKFILVAAFITAGLAQWWIGFIMELRRVARVWAAWVAITAGTLATRMELGVVGIILSTVMASLAIAAVMNLIRKRNGRAAVIFTLALVLLILSGQAYVQVGFLLVVPLSLLPLLIEHSSWKLDRLAGPLLLAGLAAIILCAFTILPMARLLPRLEKFDDVGFAEAQPMEYVPINLVISSIDYLRGTILKPIPYPDRTGNFVGWLPVIFALFAFRYAKGERNRWLLFFSLGVILSVVATSGWPLKMLIPLWDGVQTIRFPQWFAGITVTMLLGLSGIGLDGILANLDSPQPGQELLPPKVSFIRKMVLGIGVVVLMAWGVKSTVDFSSRWVLINPQIGSVDLIYRLPLDHASWFEIDQFAHFLNLPLADRGFKLGKGMNPLILKGISTPPAEFALYPGPDVEQSIKIGSYEIFNLYWRPQNQYAYALVGTEKVTCKANAVGGNIDVTCDLPHSGQLFVMENIWDGWYVWVDGQPAKLGEYTQWLSVSAPIGKHTYQFRYIPWDVPLGFLLTIPGWFLVVWWWKKNPVW